MVITLGELEAEYHQWCSTHKKSHPTWRDEAGKQPATPAGLVHHVVPDYILHHPDPRVRDHWKRIYHRTAILKEQYAREGGLVCQP